MTEYEIELFLFLSDPKVTPEEISDITGMTPDRASHRGSRSLEPPLPKVNVWHLRSPAPAENSSIGQQWDGLWKRVEPYKANFAGLPASVRRRLVFAVYAHKYFPGLEFPVEVLRQIADFGIPFEISTYDLVDDEAESDEAWGNPRPDNESD